MPVFGKKLILFFEYFLFKWLLIKSKFFFISKLESLEYYIVQEAICFKMPSCNLSLRDFSLSSYYH